MPDPVREHSPAGTGKNFAADERGATAVEYGLMAGLISLVIMSTVFALGTDIKTVLYDKIATALAGM